MTCECVSPKTDMSGDCMTCGGKVGTAATTDYDLRSALVRSLADTRSQIENVERLIRERDRIVHRIAGIAAILRSDTACLLDGKPRANLEKTIRQLDELVTEMTR
jgi:hypothetical protein